MTPVRRPLRTLRYGALTCALLLAGFVAGFIVGRGRTRAPELPDLGPAPQYTLTNQLGQTVSSKRFVGKVRLVTFIYARPVTVLRQLDEGTALFDRKSELAALPDEGQPPAIIVTIASLPAVSARRSRQEPNLFVVSDGGRVRMIGRVHLFS